MFVSITSVPLAYNIFVPLSDAPQLTPVWPDTFTVSVYASVV